MAAKAADSRRGESSESADVAGGQSASSSSTRDSKALQSKDNVVPQASQAGASETTVEAGTKGGRSESLVTRQQPRFARIVVTCEMLPSVLGPELYESEVAARVAVPGMSTGLAWTPTGGELLFIECASMPGCGNVKLTGKLGEVRDHGYMRYRRVYQIGRIKLRVCCFPPRLFYRPYCKRQK